MAQQNKIKQFFQITHYSINQQNKVQKYRRIKKKNYSSFVSKSFKISQILAFEIYDINQNRIIDEKDIISIIQLVHYFSNLEVNLAKILINASYRYTEYENQQDFYNNNQQQIEKQSLTKSRNQKKIKEKINGLENPLPTSFKKEKNVYIFTNQTYDFNINLKNHHRNWKISITKKFKNILEKQGPAIFYDLSRSFFGLEVIKTIMSKNSVKKLFIKYQIKTKRFYYIQQKHNLQKYGNIKIQQ